MSGDCAATPRSTALELVGRTATIAVVVHNNDGQIVGVATLALLLDGLSRPSPAGPGPDSVERVSGGPP
jgi:CBS domain-containing protein